MPDSNTKLFGLVAWTTVQIVHQTCQPLRFQPTNLAPTDGCPRKTRHEPKYSWLHDAIRLRSLTAS